MPIFSRNATALAERKPVLVEGDTYYKSDWMDSGRDPAFSPTVFLVEQAPHVSLRTHFHRQDQFQLFVRGGGRLGPHDVTALTAHYAGAYTGYGPLVAGPEGLAYFTLRPVWETGSLTMKEHPHEMRRGPKRALHSAPARTAALGELLALPAPVVEELIPRQPDGVAARLHSLPPAATLRLQADPGHAGQFHVVVAGSVEVDGRLLTDWASMFVAAGETPPAIRAGARGAQLACLQFPPKAAQYL